MKISRTYLMRFYFFALFIFLSFGFVVRPAFAQGQTSLPTVYCLSPNCPVTPTEPFVQNTPTGIQQSPNVSPTISQASTLTTVGIQHKHKEGGGGNTNTELNFLQQLINLIIQLVNELTGGTIPPTGTTPTPAVTQAPTDTPAPTAAPAPTDTPVPTVSPSPATPTAVITPPVAIPVQNTLNWAGYEFSKTISSGDSISASWNTSTLTCSTQGNGILYPWVGFGGASAADQNLAEAGNNLDCTNLLVQGPNYNAWTDAYPAPEVDLIVPLKAGDQMTSTVTFTGNGQFQATVSDANQNWTVNVPMTFASTYVPQGGEAVMEDGLTSANTPIGGAPQFSPMVTFSNVNYTTGGQGIPIQGAPNLLENVIVEANGDQPLQVSLPSGSVFNINWQNY